MKAAGATIVALLCSAVASAQDRDPLPVPDLPGLKTLKADFHLHTVFSDGQVWPTVHVQEAWRDGLDVVALTDHVEYRPHSDDVSRDLRRPHAVARELAEQLGIILIPGVEITRPAPGTTSPLPVGSAHFNALFVEDPAALAQPGLLDALRAARAQGAFVFWNHPGFMGTLEPRWHAHVDEAWREGLFHGMELVNGEDFYPAAYPWIEEKKLTILSNSDYHVPTPPRGTGPRRPGDAGLRALRRRRRRARGARRAPHRGLARRRRLGRRGAPARPLERRGRGSARTTRREARPGRPPAAPQHVGDSVPPARASLAGLAQGGAGDGAGRGHVAPAPSRGPRRPGRSARSGAGDGGREPQHGARSQARGTLPVGLTVRER